MPEVRPELMIHNKEITPARWSILPESIAPDGDGSIIPLAAWCALPEAVRQSTGVLLEGWDDITGLSTDITAAPVIALNFPKFADGRCYSHAYRLRRVLGFTGDILAVGDVLRDQMPYMARCGIYSFYPREDQPLEGCLKQLGHFTKHYQYDHISG